MYFDKSYLLLSAGNALLGHVAPSLRAFTVDFNEKEKFVSTCFFYDGEIDDHLFDLASCTTVEIELNSGYTYREPLIRIDYPEKIPFEGNLIYLRFEPNLEGHYLNVRFSQLLKKTDSPYAFLFLDMQNALLAKVTPALRKVSTVIDENKKTIDLYFYYDGKISDHEYQLATRAAQAGVISFPHFSQRTHIERIDFPQRLPQKGGRAVYMRYEEMSLLLD
jgi:hypothetical protein